MVAKITRGGGGSAGGLVDYLEKEEQGKWFNQDKEDIGPLEVTTTIDANKRNLGKEDDKYYQVIISPSEKELLHIGNDPQKLKEYTRQAMEEYANNFNKGIESKDLTWYAKIEHGRKWTHQDKAVQLHQAEKGKDKEGLQTHIHVIVSRTENLERFKERKLSGEISRKNPLKLSPATNHQSTEKGAVKGGFSRTKFIEACEQKFDKQFSYQRSLNETFQYSNTLQNGSSEGRVKMQIEALKEQHHIRNQEKQLDKGKEQEKSRNKGMELDF